MIDCHVHTARCGHGEGSAAEYVAAARTKGIGVLTFTEHLPLPESLDPCREYSMAEHELPAYLHEIGVLASASQTAPARPTVLTGIEADWLPSHLPHVERLLSAFSFDLVLGSVHFLEGWAFDDPRLMQQWDRADVDAVWEQYFGLLVDAARSGLFDAMAHPDLVKKFGYRPTFDPRELYEAAAGAFAATGTAVELSTAGLRKPVGELYPSMEFLTACARAGVPATLGSDAHRPDEVGAGFEMAREALEAVGYDRLVYFVGRERREYAL